MIGHRKSTVCHKIGQGQPRVIIYTKFVDLEPLISDNQTSGSGDDFYGILPYMDMVVILGHVMTVLPSNVEPTLEGRTVT